MPTDPQSLYDQAKCLDCFSSPGLLQLAQVGLEKVITQSAQENQGVPGPSGAVPIPTGLVLSETVGAITATWDALPAGLDGTQVQTSSTGANGPWAKTFNFVASPGTSMVFASPLVGQQLCVRIRFRKNGVYSAWSAGVCHTYLGTNPQALDWASRVVTNGGAIPSQTSINAGSAFWTAMQLAGLDSKLKHVNIVAPDSMIAFRTPFYKGIGTNDPYLIGSVPGTDLTVNGFKCAAGAGRFSPGINLTTDFSSDNDLGATWYVHTGADVNHYEFGYFSAGSQFAFAARWSFTGATKILCNDLNGGGGRISVAPIAGYHSMNRVALNDLRLYRASSTHPHAQDGSYLVNGTGNRVNTDFPFFAGSDTIGGFLSSTNRISFIALHLGLSQAQSLTLYNAVQALRTALGGGFV